MVFVEKSEECLMDRWGDQSQQRLFLHKHLHHFKLDTYPIHPDYCLTQVLNSCFVVVVVVVEYYVGKAKQ